MKLFILFLLYVIPLFGQEMDESFLLKPKVKIGTMFSGLSVWTFSTGYWYDELTHNINPNIFIGFGIETKNIDLIYPTKFSFTLEASYGIAKTQEVKLTGSPADFKIISVPVLFLVKIKSSGKIVPYVRAGLGYEKIEMKETYYLRPTYGFDKNDWFFCYCIGAGIDFNIFDHVNFSLFVDGLIKEHSFNISVSQPREWWANLDFRNSNLVTGLEFSYNF